MAVIRFVNGLSALRNRIAASGRARLSKNMLVSLAVLLAAFGGIAKVLMASPLETLGFHPKPC